MDMKNESIGGVLPRFRTYVLGAGLLGGLLGAAIALGVGWVNFKPVQERSQLTPPVVIVDLVMLAKQYPEGASVEEVEKLMLKTNASLLKLRDAGYLVLDAQAVLAAPADLMLSAELMQ